MSNTVVRLLYINLTGGKPLKVDKEARKFAKEYELTHPIKSSDIERIIKHQGFKIVRYNESENDEATKLINHLRLSEYIHLVNCFTYFDNKYKILFIREGLSDDDEKQLFLHEEGHIYLHHFHEDRAICSTGITKEQEAHRFAKYVQKYVKVKSRVKSALIPTCLSLIICTIFLMIYICMPQKSTTVSTGTASTVVPESIYNESTSSHNDGSGVSIGLPSENNNVSSFIPNESSDIGSVNPNLNETEICYWTKSGEVYHLYSDCQHIKNSSIVFSGPVSESGKERVCRTCYSRYIMEEYNTDGLN